MARWRTRTTSTPATRLSLARCRGGHVKSARRRRDDGRQRAMHNAKEQQDAAKKHETRYAHKSKWPAKAALCRHVWPWPFGSTANAAGPSRAASHAASGRRSPASRGAQASQCAKPQPASFFCETLTPAATRRFTTSNSLRQHASCAGETPPSARASASTPGRFTRYSTTSRWPLRAA